MIRIPLTVVAKNEARAIGPCLDSIRAAIAVAQAQRPIAIEPLVVADDCTDETEAIARGRGVAVVASSGGKVAAQSRGVRPGPFQVLCDADITMSPTTLLALCGAMLDRPALFVASPAKVPLLPRRGDPLAWALYQYNLHRGFSSQRTWFSGKLFAIRELSFPSASQMQDRAARLAPDRFYDYDAGMRIDDIYLSRWVLAEHGPRALCEVPDATIWFRAPETLEGMYRYYRRMRMELRRIDALFPEWSDAQRQHGTREPDRLASAPASQRRAWRIFRSALAVCRARYRAERWYFRHLASQPCDPWPVVRETKDLSCST